MRPWLRVWGMLLGKIVLIAKRAAWSRLMLITGLLMEFIHILLAVFFYFFLIYSSSGSPEEWFKYIFVGLAILPMLDWSLSGPYLCLDNAYFNMELQWVCLSETDPILLVIAQHIAGYGRVMVTTLMYVSAGLLVGIRIPLNCRAASMTFLILLLGCASTTGIGLLLSTMFLHLSRIRGLSNPILVFLSFFSTNFCGAYFPVDSLPPIPKAVAVALPQTHVIHLVRGVIGGYRPWWAPQPYVSIAYLLATLLVSIPLSQHLFRRGIVKVKREGFIIPPQRSFVRW